MKGEIGEGGAKKKLKTLRKQSGGDNALKGKADWRTICGVWRSGCKEAGESGRRGAAAVAAGVGGKRGTR